jgi:two-component system cell cycle response regulator
MHDGVPWNIEDLHAGRRSLFRKGSRVLQEHRLEITKRWLGRIIGQIDDLDTLESFPTQESIRTSVELIEGLAAALEDDAALAEFESGGRFYERAGLLGLVGSGNSRGLVTLSQNVQALESAIWEHLTAALRTEDQDLLSMIARLRSCLAGINTAAAEAYYQRSSSELDRLAHTDPLTGVYNRRYLVQELERHVEIFKRYHHPFSLLMLDMDNLKLVNDTHGHAAGDAALRHMAMLMKVNVRDVDIPCRFGGDEFVILMPETDKEVVEIVGRRIAESLMKTKLKVEASLVTLQVSSGSASCPADGRESEELLQHADENLYRAKQRRGQAGEQTG